MAKKKYSKEFVIGRPGFKYFNELSAYVNLDFLNGQEAAGFCSKTFFRVFGIPRKLLNRRKHRVLITIEFLKEL